MAKIYSNGRIANVDDAAMAECVYETLVDLGYSVHLMPDVPKIENFLINEADMYFFELARETNAKIRCIKYIRVRTDATLLEAKLWLRALDFQGRKFL